MTVKELKDLLNKIEESAFIQIRHKEEVLQINGIVYHLIDDVLVIHGE